MILKQIGLCIPLLDHFIRQQEALYIVQEYNRRHSGPSKVNDFSLNILPLPHFLASDQDLSARCIKNKSMQDFGSTFQLVAGIISALAFGILFKLKLLPLSPLPFIILSAALVANHIFTDLYYRSKGLENVSLESIIYGEAKRLSLYIDTKAKKILDTIFIPPFTLEKLPIKSENSKNPIQFYQWKSNTVIQIFVEKDQSTQCIELYLKEKITNPQWLLKLSNQVLDITDAQGNLVLDQTHQDFLRTLLKHGKSQLQDSTYTLVS